MSSTTTKSVAPSPTVSLAAAAGASSSSEIEEKTNTLAAKTLAQTPAVAAASGPSSSIETKIAWNLPPKLTKIYGNSFHDCWWRAAELLFGDQFEKEASKHPEIVKFHDDLVLLHLCFQREIPWLLENVCSTNTSNPSFSTKVFSEITPSTESPAKLFQELLNKKTDQNLSRILLVALMHIFSKFKEENSHANFYEYLKSLDPIKIEKLRITASSAFYKTFLNKYPDIGSVSFLQVRIK